MHAQPVNSLGTKLFLARILKNPRQLGAIAPSSRFLGSLLIRHIDDDGVSPIVELGGGSGSLTRALIKAGIAPKRLYVVELDEALAKYLQQAFPEVNVIHGNAAELGDILPSEVIGKALRVVSGLPMINFPESVRSQILDSIFQILGPEGSYLQYTYSPKSSIDAEAYQLTKERMGMTFLNLPPATVWQYRKAKAPALDVAA